MRILIIAAALFGSTSVLAENKSYSINSIMGDDDAKIIFSFSKSASLVRHTVILDEKVYYCFQTFSSDGEYLSNCLGN